jgi:hypothetical protein
MTGFDSISPPGDVEAAGEEGITKRKGAAMSRGRRTVQVIIPEPLLDY